MFQCYLQPAQEKFSCPHCSSPLVVPTAHLAALSTLGRGCSAQSPPSRWEPALHTVPTLLQELWHLTPRVRGSAGSPELTQLRIRD